MATKRIPRGIAWAPTQPVAKVIPHGVADPVPDQTPSAGNAYTGNMLDNRTPPVGAAHPYGPRGQAHAPRSTMFRQSYQTMEGTARTGPSRLGTDQSTIHNVPGMGYVLSGAFGELI